ncbi:twin-arginine translocase TatA/TatE family subunit [Nocardioides sp. YIM B13467]|uniref:Sec-independent protein translocase subunit TatA/TatB n=1 Tax=Nocardioides sp. YIM B13467 TaxID=3366294 RepID=UPI00366E095A
MFGLTFEKLFLVAIVAGLVIGPQRLPIYTRRLAELIRSFRSLIDTSKARAELEALDVRQYDPRRIVREALTEPAAALPADEAIEADLEEQASRVRPGQKYLVSGGSAHPRRILIESLPADDPRRVAAYVPSLAADDETELLLAEVNRLLEESALP